MVLNHLGWAAVLGLPTGIFGKQADDEGGRFLRGAMDRLGIAREIVLDGSASSSADIYVDDAGGRAIYMAPGATSETTPEHVRAHHAATIRGALRVTTEVSQLPLAAVREVLALANDAGVPTLLDLDVPPRRRRARPRRRRELRGRAARGADPEAREGGGARARARGRRATRSRSPRRCAKRFGSEAVVVTDGAAGCAIAAEGVALRVPAYRVAQVIDSTGAGDAFLGGLLVALAAGLGWDDAAQLANACGAACVEKLGAFPDDPAWARERDPRALRREEARAPGSGRAAPAAPSAAGADALAAFDVAVEELAALAEAPRPGRFERAVALLRETEAAGGRVHVTGIGKPEHVAHYAASLFSSTGTPATFLHGTEAVHGSAGQVVRGDVVIAISNSGATELVATADAVRALGARVIAVTGNPRSPLAARADLVLDAGVAREGGGLGFAPRASVAAELLVLAALSAALESARGFTRAEYHARHPGGSLGQKSK